MTDALPTFIRSPLRGLRAAREVGRTAVRLARCAVDERLGPVSIPLGAPDTFESPVGADRAVSFAELDMREGAGAEDALRVDDQRRRARRLLGGAARAPGRARPGHREPAGGRRAGVGPRRQRAAPQLGNHLSAMFVPLSNDKKTPLERLRTVTAASASARARSVPWATGRWRRG